MLFEITTQLFDNKIQLIDLINDLNCTSFFFEEKQTTKMQYWSLKISNTNSCQIHIGIVCQVHGIKPNYLFVVDKNLIVVFFNKKILGLNISSKKILFEHEFEAVVFQVEYFEDENNFLIVFETGLTRLDSNGDIIWNFSCDIIESINLEWQNQTAQITFMDDPSITLNIKNGTIQKLMV